MDVRDIEKGEYDQKQRNKQYKEQQTAERERKEVTRQDERLDEQQTLKDRIANAPLKAEALKAENTAKRDVETDKTLTMVDATPDTEIVSDETGIFNTAGNMNAEEVDTKEVVQLHQPFTDGLVSTVSAIDGDVNMEYGDPDGSVYSHNSLRRSSSPPTLEHLHRP
ncbi:hypothetical protein SARC_17271, partial [Sphaeroforma arctica JP610]